MNGSIEGSMAMTVKIYFNTQLKHYFLRSITRGIQQEAQLPTSMQRKNSMPMPSNNIEGEERNTRNPQDSRPLLSQGPYLIDQKEEEKKNTYSCK